MHKFIIALCAVFFFSHLAYAGKILRTKGKNVVIDISGENVSKGDKLNVYQGKKRRGVVRVRKINKSGTKALGRILLGKARKGWLAATSVPEDTIEGAEAVATTSDSDRKLYYGLLLGLSMDSMTVKLSTSEVDITGNGYSIKVAADYLMSKSFHARLKTGMQLFSASGDATGTVPPECSTCEVEINYFNLEGLAQYYISHNKYRFWLGAGGAIAHPLSASSNAIDEDSLSTTSAIQVGGGLDIHMKNGKYIPLEFLYSLLPESDDVQATYITISAGYMF